MSERKWISKMGPLKKGALHRPLGVPEGKRIPLSKLMKASHAGGKTGARARLAMAFRTMGHK